MNYFFKNKHTKFSLIIVYLTLTIIGSPVFININQSVLAQTEINDIEAKTREIERLFNEGKRLFLEKTVESYQQGIINFQEALVLAQEIGDENIETALKMLLTPILLNDGIRLMEEGTIESYQQGKIRLEESLSFCQEYLCQQPNSESLETSIYLMLGRVNDLLGFKLEAYNYYDQSLSLFREIGDKKGEASILFIQGATLILREREAEAYQQAIIKFTEALTLYQEIGDQSQEAFIYLLLGKIYNDLKLIPETLTNYNQALSLYQRLGDKRGEARSLNNLASIYLYLGKNQEALEYLEQSLELNRAINNPDGEISNLNNLGYLYNQLGEKERALNYYQEALSLAQKFDDASGGISVAIGASAVVSNEEEKVMALDYLQSGLVLSRLINEPIKEANIFNNLGFLSNDLGDKEKALEYYQQALTLTRNLGDRSGEATTLGNMGLFFAQQNNLTEAEKYLFDSINIRESINSSELEDSFKISFFDTYIKYYLYLQKVFIQQNKINQALEIAERGRARAFIELLATRQAENLDPQIKITPPNITEIQNIAKQQNATLVEYTLISENELYIWVIKPTGEINFKSVESPENLISLIGKSRQQLNVDAPRNFGLSDVMNANSLDKLYQILIEPINEFLPTDPNQKVIFIPHQELFLVPFPALKNSQGQYLIEKHTILTAPSIQTLQMTHNIRENNSNFQGEKLIIGNPKMPSIANMDDLNLQRQPLAPLPYAETEALNIANFLNTQALIGDRATEESIKPRLSNAQIIHFATHGLLYYGDPTQSAVKDVPGAIALASSASEDGFLTSSEILGLNLSANLVVLSACQTGKGRITGDGVIGLSRSFISAGVPSVVVSLWSVDDESTSELMTAFYQNLENNLDKAQALRQAMLSVKENHPQPQYWGGFTLIGES